MQVLNLEVLLKGVPKTHNGTNLNLDQAVPACSLCRLGMKPKIIVECIQVLNLEGQLKGLHKTHEGTKLNLAQAVEACNFATKKRRAAERQLAKLQVS